MKKIALLIAFFIGTCIGAFAAFSGNYLCVRKGGVTHKHRLYTSTTDAGTSRLAVRISGSTRYAKLSEIAASGEIMKIRRSGATQVVAKLAHVFGLKWGSNGTGDGQFVYPAGAAVDSSGNVYVADTGNHRIQKFTSTGTFITRWGSYGTGDGQFNNPRKIYIDPFSNVYVTDTGNFRIQKFTSTGTFITKWGSNGTGDGQFENPAGAAVDSSGNVYVADDGNHRIQKFE